jgi:fucose 4-O-acetylase-like acetyltransferase
MDIARAIGIVLVVIGHYIPDDSPDWYVVLRDAIYKFHMPLFMFLSGYVYWATKKPMKYGTFVWKKFQRLMIPCFFVSVVIITIKLVTEKELSVENPVTSVAFREMFYLPVAGYFLWFVYCLFLIFLIIPFFHTYKQLMFLLVVSLIVFFIPVDFPKLFCMAEMKRNFIYFVLGCVVFDRINIRRSMDRIYFPVAFFIFIGVYILKSNIDNRLINGLITLVLALTGIVFAVNMSKYMSRKTAAICKLLSGISVYSYTIYLFHTTFEGFAKAAVKTDKISAIVDLCQKDLRFIICAVAVISAGIICPVVLHETAVRYCKPLSFLLGTKFAGKSNHT